MNIFGSIMGAIFGHPVAAQGTSQGGASASPTPAAAAAAPVAPAAGGGAKTVDVEAVMNDLASRSEEKLDWRKSIVDLLKLLNLDATLNARKELAKELGYTGELNGSAEMNTWLHKQVMQKLAANGGKVPADLR
jgi:hypothetical protein